MNVINALPLYYRFSILGGGGGGRALGEETTARLANPLLFFVLVTPVVWEILERCYGLF